MPQLSHREQLLAAAVECLHTKGYARTTARDIATTANANLASIGYHFGSKEGLLNAAIAENFQQWTRHIGEAAFAAPGGSPLERMASSWIVILESFEEQRPLLVAFVEAMAQVERSAELRSQMAAHYREVRTTVAEMVRASLGDDAEALGAEPNVVASFLIAVSDGFVLQWLLDPDKTPKADELIKSLAAALGIAMRDMNDLTATAEGLMRPGE